ncbi:hypothetical protein BKA70DRAFT_1237651 [Coprinopsis sp. MPI-PUGE-AT-0042]|nr:hypothetical protein BKA70DRAFT_1237651 [Coprinopsis sp. MPI-PUGE-AT-0042]
MPEANLPSSQHSPRHRLAWSRTFPGSSSRQSLTSAAKTPSLGSPSPLEPSKISQRKRLYESVTISQANQTLASSPRRARHVQFFLVEFGSYREKSETLFGENDDLPEDLGNWHYGAFSDVLDVVKKMMGLEVVEDDTRVDAGAVKTPAVRTWDATELALKALETMSSLTDLRVKVRKGASRLTPELNRIISARSFKLKTLFCDSRLDLKALIKAHRSTLEVLVVWMWNGYNATADLTPFMHPAPSGVGQDPYLIIAGLEPIDSASRSEDAIMLFPKYMAVKGEAEESGAPSGRTLGEALDILKTVFARDTRAREGIRLRNMTTVICCVESLSGAGVNTTFTRSMIVRHCKLVKEFVIYYDKFGGLLSNTLAKSLSSFRKLEVLHVHGWNPQRLGAKWKKVA